MATGEVPGGMERCWPVARVSSVRATAPRAAPGDTDSFVSFYRGQVDTIYRALALTLTDPGLAREATDEAMLRAYARWSTVGGYENPSGWVYRVGLNWATSRRRRTSRERPLSTQDMSGSSEPPDPAGLAALAALAHLTVRHRAVVVARVLLDLSTAETATVLGIPENTVKSRLARALASLRTELAIGDDDE
jgi:RNA polymerase sigma factor (sigma-70 family)